jgi:hypothetical protein
MWCGVHFRGWDSRIRRAAGRAAQAVLPRGGGAARFARPRPQRRAAARRGAQHASPAPPLPAHPAPPPFPPPCRLQVALHVARGAAAPAHGLRRAQRGARGPGGPAPVAAADGLVGRQDAGGGGGGGADGGAGLWAAQGGAQRPDAPGPAPAGAHWGGPGGTRAAGRGGRRLPLRPEPRERPPLPPPPAALQRLPLSGRCVAWPAPSAAALARGAFAGRRPRSCRAPGPARGAGALQGLARGGGAGGLHLGQPAGPHPLPHPLPAQRPGPCAAARCCIAPLRLAKCAALWAQAQQTLA